MNAPTAADGAVEAERRIGRRIIRSGDVVKIKGLGRACVRVAGEQVPGFKVVGFRGAEVLVVEHLRTFPVDRVGARPRRSRSTA